MVDLLKLAVARRVGTRGKETLGAVLTAMAKTNTEVGLLWFGDPQNSSLPTIHESHHNSQYRLSSKSTV